MTQAYLSTRRPMTRHVRMEVPFSRQACRATRLTPPPQFNIILHVPLLTRNYSAPRCTSALYVDPARVIVNIYYTAVFWPWNVNFDRVRHVQS